jgi:uncharacterized protein YndB with AHSA1/START domain
METQPVVVEHTYSAKPEAIWKALTRNEEMKKWYFDLPEFFAEVGFQFEFSAGSRIFPNPIPI